MNTNFKKGNRIGPYKLLDYLGRGGFGEVWRAERTPNLIGLEFALKIFTTTNIDLDGVRKSVELWNRALPHQNIVPLFEAAEYSPNLVIATEYHPDGNLEMWLSRWPEKTAPIEAALEMTIGILEAIDHLHTLIEPVVHRDIKPANILLLGGVPRLIDFDLARYRDDTWTQNFAGTIAYMAPETIVGNARTLAVDLWAAGVILYELLSGERPFPDRRSIVQDSPLSLKTSVPQTLQFVIIKALEKEPSNRYQSASEFKAALRQVHTEMQMDKVVTSTLAQYELSLTADELEMFTNTARHDLVMMRDFVESSPFANDTPIQVEMDKTTWRAIKGIFHLRARGFSAQYHQALECAMLKAKPEHAANVPDWQENDDKNKALIAEWMSEKDAATFMKMASQDVELMIKSDNSLVPIEWRLVSEKLMGRADVMERTYYDILCGIAIRDISEDWFIDDAFQITLLREELEGYRKTARRGLK